MDPGNWILFLMFQSLIHILKKTDVSLPNDVTEHLTRINVAQEVSPSMKLGKRRLDIVGDILEAIGGICHPWASTSSTMIKQMMSEDTSLRRIMFDEPRDIMGQLARGMKQFTTCVQQIGAMSSPRRLIGDTSNRYFLDITIIF